MNDLQAGQPEGKIVIFEPSAGEARVEVRLEGETVWLAQAQMVDLFQTTKQNVSLHISNIFKEAELRRDSVVKEYLTTAADGKNYRTKFYNLDVIISVGYRLKSHRGTQFRIWATGVLRDHIIKGYSINECRLLEQAEHYRELQEAVRLVGEVLSQKSLDGPQAEGMLHVITDYAYALSILDDYDCQRLAIRNTTRKVPFRITYDSARAAVHSMADQLRKDGRNVELFGREKDESFRSSLAAVYQTFGGEDVYPSIEEKAAHLLYFIVKNHSFTDGNKRIAAAIFLWFLDRNGLLYGSDGHKRVGDNALVALTLMIAESKPQHKDTVVKVIVNLINRDNA